MGKIVRYVPRERRVITPPPDGKAEILLFTGVRYEYSRDHPEYGRKEKKPDRGSLTH